MAVYFLNLKTFGRSGGSSAVSAAAYRAGERIRDERTGRTYDHTDRQDVLHKEILVPGRFAGADMSWATDRANLWNLAESAESRKNARVAREYLVALPVELDAEQRLKLVRGFSQEMSDRYQFALDLTVHEPRRFPGSDPRNFHAHLLATTREATPEGLTTKTTLELSDAKRRDLGLEPAVHELFHVRERWAIVTNDALRAAHIDARVDEMERHGYRSAHAERLRADYAARVEAREALREQSRAVARESAPARAPDAARDGEPRNEAQSLAKPQSVARPQSLDEIRRQARENWLKMRQQSAETSALPEHSRDDQFSR
jgi:hypothetical protein